MYKRQVHNHPLYAHWLAQPTEALVEARKGASPSDLETDVISAVVELGSRRVLDRAEVYMISDGLSREEIEKMDYIPLSLIHISAVPLYPFFFDIK